MSKEDVNIIIPFGHSEAQPERDDILHFVVEECLRKQTHSNTRLILMEAGEYKTQDSFAKQTCDEYHFLPLDGKLFSPGIVQNEGYLQAKSAPYTYIHQADFLLPQEGVEGALEVMEASEAPFVFPYYGVVNLSKPVTEAVITNMINWQLLHRVLTDINTTTREEQNINPGEFNRVFLTTDQLQKFGTVLPASMSNGALSHYTQEDLWGVDDGSFTYFKKPTQDSSHTFIDYRIGPRAKASYLARSRAYEKVGGTANFQGWGYEDLTFWEKVKTFYDYDISKTAITFSGIVLTGNYPLVHLWHSTANRPEYYGQMESNKAQYEEFMKQSVEAKMQSVQPLRRGVNAYES